MTPPSRATLLVVLVAMSAIGPIGMHVIVPSLPALQIYFDTEYATVQQAVTFYILFLAIGQLIHGPLSDRFGRRPVILGGIAVFLVGGLVSATAESVTVLVAGRILQALGGCVGVALGRAIVRDLYDRDRAAQMIAWVTMPLVLAPMVAPSIGGLLDAVWGWRACFVFLMVAGAVIWVVVFLRLEETNVHRGQAVPARDLVLTYGYLLRRREILGYVFQNACMISTFFAFLGAGPYVAVFVLGLTPSGYAGYFVLVAFGFMIGMWVAGRISGRFGTRRMVWIGNVVAIVGAVVEAACIVLWPQSSLAFFAPMMIITAGSGITLPNAIAGAVNVDPARAGAASGLTGSMQMALGALCSHVIASQMDDSALPVALAVVILTVLAAAFYAWGVRGRA